VKKIVQIINICTILKNIIIDKSDASMICIK